MRILVVYASFGPYHMARARGLSTFFSEATFVEIAGRQKKYPWETSVGCSEIIQSQLFRNREFSEIRPIELLSALWKKLDEIMPEIVVIGSLNAFFNLVIACWAKLHNKIAILQSDSWYGDKKRVKGWQFIKGLILRFFFKAVFVSGYRAYNYYRSFGFSPENMIRGYDVVDNQHFSTLSDQVGLRPGLRADLSLPDDSYFICPARFHPLKDHITLIRAYYGYRQAGGKWHLVLVGNGPLRKKIRQKITRLSLDDYVQIRKWASYQEMPKLLALSECLILPSISEPWGLVVNEALACNIPVIISDKCGCGPDLCHHGRNGFIFKARDDGELKRHMLRISSGEIDLKTFGRRGGN